MYKASVIVSIYDNVPFLKAVLDSLKLQTEKDFEIIISEDGENCHVREFIESYHFENDYQHLTQKDEGWRKNKALNNAIKAAKSDWLIFVDGDCVLHHRFVEMHLRYADEQSVLAGKRVKLNRKLSEFILSDSSNLKKIQQKLIPELFRLKPVTGFVEEGIFIPPTGLLKWIVGLRQLNHLKGCNMSFSRKAIEAINGFDEDYMLPAIGEDTDLSWRFEAAGYKHKSIRNLAVQYHLFHTESWVDQEENMKIYTVKKANNEFICKNGLTKHFVE